MTRRFTLIGVVLALLISMGETASAQATDQPGGERPRPQSSLDATIDLFSAIDDTFGQDASAVPDGVERLATRRTFWGGNSQLLYQRAWDRYQLSANAGASVRRFSLQDDGLRPGYSGALDISGPLGRRTTWSLTQSLGYGPTNVLPFFGVAQLDRSTPAVPVVDYSVSTVDRLTAYSRGSLTHSISRRGSLTFSGGVEYADGPGFEDDSRARPSFRRWNGAGRYSYQASRYALWYAGYGLTHNDVTRTSEFGLSPNLHTIDAGLAYDRPLSFSRRTRVSFQVGSTVVQSASSRRREWRASGNAGLQHQIGRTWEAQLFYLRDSRYVPAFADPILNDALTAQIGGRLTLKQSISFLGNYSTGSVGVANGDNGYHGVSTSATYRYAFLQQMAVYVEYFLLDFEFDNSLALPDTLLGATRRHGVRLGLTIGTGLRGTRRRGALPPTGESTR